MCPISFNMYGMKLVERYFSFRTVIIHFGDHKSQKSLNMSQEKMSDLVSFTFSQKTEKF